jgi:hypothetical protein
VLLAVLSLPQRAEARRFFRARFEPDTLELQQPGNLEIDWQMGGLYGDGVDGSRAIIPDLELDLGLTDWLEVDIDGAFSLTQLGGPHTQIGGDPLWTSLRFELLNVDDDEGDEFGIGLQVGPRFRTFDNAKGVGLGSLLLIGGGSKRLHAVANIGAFLDRDQAYAIAFGGDLEYDLERKHKWSLQAQLAGAHYFGDTHGDDDPDQIFILAGFGAQVSESLELSMLLLTGPFARGDRIGALVDATWDHKLW